LNNKSHGTINRRLKVWAVAICLGIFTTFGNIVFFAVIHVGKPNGTIPIFQNSNISVGAKPLT
jgi:hypothetical protein